MGNFNSVRLHPATQIALWLILAVSMPWQHAVSLLTVSLLMLGFVAVRRPAGLLKLLRRTRYLLLSLLLIYAFATPGEPLLSVFPSFGPTREGLSAGLIQVWRLAVLLVGLAWLLAVSRDGLLAGVYVLLRPFKILGVDVDRVAVRIWLTLHYAERTELRRFEDWRERFRDALAPAPVLTDKVVLDLGVFGPRDLLALAAAALCLIGLVLL